jgi:hypothetical protein
MKDGKRIIIRTPFLKNLRKNMRRLINELFNDEFEKLTNKVLEIIKERENQEDEIRKDQMTVKIKNLSEKKRNLIFSNFIFLILTLFYNL